MLLVLKPNSEEVGREAARVVANAVRRNPALRLGLATGSTMVGMYKELVRLRHDLLEEFNPSEDSLRLYFLGEEPNRRVEHYGQKPSSNFEDALIV